MCLIHGSPGGRCAFASLKNARLNFALTSLGVDPHPIVVE